MPCEEEGPASPEPAAEPTSRLDALLDTHGVAQREDAEPTALPQPPADVAALHAAPAPTRQADAVAAGGSPMIVTTGAGGRAPNAPGKRPTALHWALLIVGALVVLGGVGFGISRLDQNSAQPANTPDNPQTPENPDASDTSDTPDTPGASEPSPATPADPPQPTDAPPGAGMPAGSPEPLERLERLDDTAQPDLDPDPDPASDTTSDTTTPQGPPIESPAPETADPVEDNPLPVGAVTTDATAALTAGDVSSNPDDAADPADPADPVEPEPALP